MLNSKTTALAAVLALTSTMAFAGNAPLAKMEAGEDASITREDALARVAARFDRADVNGDGVLDATDREARKAAAVDETEGKQGQRDVRGARKEGLKAMARMFEKADADGSGEVSFEEFAEFGKAMHSRMKADGPHGHMADGPRAEKGDHPHAEKGDHPRAGKGKRPDPDAVFEHMDKDGDGMISKDEFKAGAKAQHDGKPPAERGHGKPDMK